MSMCFSVLLQELPGHGESPGVSIPLLVRAVSGLHHGGHQDFCVRTGLPASLLLFPAVWHPAIGQTIQDPPRPVGLSHHL